MANTKSAIKRIRRISRQTTVNKTRKSRFRNAIKFKCIIFVSFVRPLESENNVAYGGIEKSIRIIIIFSQNS